MVLTPGQLIEAEELSNVNNLELLKTLSEKMVATQAKMQEVRMFEIAMLFLVNFFCRFLGFG
jgi:hypothetical protein